MAGSNLFLKNFDSEEDLKVVLEGRPWLFRWQLIIFERLLQPINQSQIHLVMSPFWIKVGSCPSECNRKRLDARNRGDIWGSDKCRRKRRFLPFENSARYYETFTLGDIRTDRVSKESMGCF